MKITVICIGDELLIGQVTDTNSGFIARTLAPEGWEVERTEIVADDARAIEDAIERALQRTDVVITTGGLGPTADDITKPTLCRIFGGSLVFSPEVEANVAEVMAARGRELNDLTRAQAMVPDCAEVIQNRVGTAPILLFRRAPRKTLVAMPGVPFETREMFVAEVFPRLLRTYSSDVATAHLTLIVAGISESSLAEHLTSFESSLPPQLHLAYLPKPGIIRLRLDGRSTSRDELGAMMSRYGDMLRNAVTPWLIADRDIPTAEILLNRLSALSLSVATAESCTGGNIAHELTLIPGASGSVRGGVVAYSNAVKTALLGVPAGIIEANGAVSIPVVEAMAAGARQALGSDVAIATSGIAGPGGGTPEKPVGTVCVAVATPQTILSTTLRLTGSRSLIIDRATSEALIMAIRALG